MRFSLALAACIGGAALLSVTACQATEPVKGEVIGKEHEAGSLGTAKESCRWKKQSNGTSKRVCTTSTTGGKAECYELEIRTADGSEVELCDKAAYLVLDIGDPYDSTQNYSREEQ